MEISYLLLLKMEQLKFIIFKKKQLLTKKAILSKQLKLILILMLFYSIVISLKLMLLEQAKVYILEKLKEVLNQSLNGACLSLAYNKDKSYLFAGFADKTIRVYKASNKSES